MPPVSDSRDASSRQWSNTDQQWKNTEGERSGKAPSPLSAPSPPWDQKKVFFHKLADALAWKGVPGSGPLIAGATTAASAVAHWEQAAVAGAQAALADSGDALANMTAIEAAGATAGFVIHAPLELTAAVIFGLVLCGLMCYSCCEELVAKSALTPPLFFGGPPLAPACHRDCGSFRCADPSPARPRADAQ